MNTILFLNYFMCAIFLQTSPTIPWRIRIWLSLLFLHHMCLYNAHRVKSAGQGTSVVFSNQPPFSFLCSSRSSQTLKCITYFMAPNLCSLLYDPLWKIFILPDPSQMTCSLWNSLIFSFSCVMFGVGRGVYISCIIILCHSTYHAFFLF